MNRNENTLRLWFAAAGWTQQTERRMNWRTAAKRSSRFESDSVGLPTRTSTESLINERSKRSERPFSSKRLVSRRQWLILRLDDQIVLSRLEEFLELTKAASTLYNLALPAEKRDFVKKLTSNFGVSGERIVITLSHEANVIANRQLVSSGSPRRGVHRTFSRILTKLLKMFEEHDVSQPQPLID